MGSQPADLVVLIPVLGRPHRVEPVYKAFKRTVPSARILFIADWDDEEEWCAIDKLLPMPARPTSEPIYCGWQGDQCMALTPPATWPKKINAGYHATTEPFLFLGADDIEPHPGWYEAAQAKMKPGIGVVGTNDLANPRVIAGHHSTHMLVRRSYVEEFGTIDEPGKIVHEGYFSDYADDELVQTAIHRGAYAHAHDSVVEHLHCLVGTVWNPNDRPGKLADDATYALGRSQSGVGRYVFRQRRRLWENPAT